MYQQKIGFILLTHTKPHQILRLVDRLNLMFDYPPVVCHHDFSKCALPVSQFPNNITFVSPYLKTGWAEFSVVEATVRSIERMYKSSDDPQWFVVLSGADYPIKSAKQILSDLNCGYYDAHIYFKLIKPDSFENDWQRMCYERYYAKTISFPFVKKKLSPKGRILKIKNSLFTRVNLPFSKNLQCFAGSQWFCGNRKAAHYIVDFHMRKPKLANHYRNLMFSEESYFHTILANAPHLRLNGNNWRYTDWIENKSHPKTLLYGDLSKIISSPAHFARKFDMDLDAKIFDSIDSLIA